MIFVTCILSKKKNKQLQEIYLDKLIRQIQQYHTQLQNIQTIFIGGGTPLSLDIDLLKKFYYKLSDILPQNIDEFTVECNPQNTTKEKLKILKQASVNRLSFGGQSHIERLQEVIGRRNSINQLKKIIAQAQNFRI